MKKAEIEAVVLGTYLLMNAGYDSKRVAGFWERVAKYRMLSRNLNDKERNIVLSSIKSHGRVSVIISNNMVVDKLIIILARKAPRGIR
jgi:hypothetical protein